MPRDLWHSIWQLTADAPTGDGSTTTLYAAAITTAGLVLIALINAVVKSRARPAPEDAPSMVIADYSRKLAEAEALADRLQRDLYDEKQAGVVLRYFLVRLGYNPRLIATGEEPFDDVRSPARLAADPPPPPPHPRPTRG